MRYKELQRLGFDTDNNKKKDSEEIEKISAQINELRQKEFMLRQAEDQLNQLKRQTNVEVQKEDITN